MILSLQWISWPDTLLEQNREILGTKQVMSRRFVLLHLVGSPSWSDFPTLKRWTSTQFNILIFVILAEFVAQFKSTLLLLPNGTVLCTGIPVDLNLYESEYSVTDEELAKLLAESPNLVTGASSSSSSSKNKKKKKKAAAGATAESVDKENVKETPAEKKE